MIFMSITLGSFAMDRPNGLNDYERHWLMQEEKIAREYRFYSQAMDTAMQKNYARMAQGLPLYIIDEKNDIAFKLRKRDSEKSM